MENKSKGLLKGTGIYAIGTFGTKILSFLIVPLYTYYVTTTDMGVYDILMSTINLLTPLVTMQISDAAYRWIIQDDGTNKERYIRTTVQVVIFNCCAASLIILVVNQFAEIPYCLYFCGILVLSRAFQSLQKILRALRHQWLFAFAGIVYTIIFLSLNVLQLCVLKMGMEALFQSAVIAYFVALVFMTIKEPYIRINFFKKPDLKLIKEFYKYSIPLVPNYLNWWVINSSDRYIVLWALGSASNGILAISHKFPTMLQAVLSLFTNSWQDVSVADGEEKNGAYYTKVFRTYSRLALSVLWPLVPATTIVIQIVMSEAYKISCAYVPFYYMGTVFQSFASFYGVGYLRSKQTGKAFSTSVYGALINAMVNFLLIKSIGLQAASISTFIGFFIMWLLREKQNRDELQIEVKWGEMVSLTILSVAVCILSIMSSTLINLVIFIFGGVLFICVNHKEINVIIKKVIKKSHKKV